MELYGSLHNISGSVTASAFSGSFKGDGGGLYNLPASGVTGLNLSQIASGNATASISSTGFTVNKNTQIQGDLSVTGSIIATNYIVSSSVTYMTTSFASGSSAFGNDGNDVHQFTGSVQITGSISLNGQAIGTGKLDETTFQSYTSSISSSIGSLSSSIALTDVSQSNRLTTIEGNYATTGSNLFKGSQTISGSIIPSVDNTYDLGSVTHQWKDVYISSGSLYIDGTKVLGSTSQELTITTDTGQSIKILEAGSDSIILQSADGDIELKSSGGGDILFDPTNGIISIKGTTQIQDGFKITSSGGTNIVFGDSIIVSGSIDLTGNVDGIDLQSFSSSVSTSISSLLGGNTSLSSSIATTTSGLSSSIGSLSSSVATTTNDLSSSINSLSSSVATTTSGLSSSIGSLSSSVATTTNDLSSSVATTTLGIKNRVDSIETSTGSLNTFTSSASGRLTSLETASGSIRTDFNTYTGSNNTTVSTQNGRLTSIEGITGSISSLNTYTGSNNTVIGTLQTSTSSLNSYTSSNTTNIDAIHTSTGSFKSFTSSFDTAFGMSGADVTVKGNLTVSGTQTTVNSTTVAIGDNIIQLNGTGATNAGLVVRDATAPNTVSGSFLWDSTNDKWIAGALGSEDDVVLKTATQTLTNKTINGSQLVDTSVANGKLTNSSITVTAGTGMSGGGAVSLGSSVTLTNAGVTSITTNTGLSSNVSATGAVTITNTITNNNQLTNGAAYITGITSGNVTTALGFTPYNSTNPSGYISSITSGNVTTALGYTPYNSTNPSAYIALTALSFVAGSGAYNNTTGVITIPTNNNQLTNGAGYITGINSSAVTTALGFTPYNATNPSGYISSITSGNVTTALGFTPYNATNPSGYITGINSSAVTTALGFTPYNATNPSGYISSESDTLGTVTNRGNSTSQNIVFSNGRKGLVGVYDAAQTQAIFAMGIDYILTNGAGSGTIGNHYGLAWSYNPDYGGAGNNPQSKAGLNHQLLLMQAGVTTAAMGSGIWTSGNISAANFSGSHSGTSSGTNTGDQTNISGNAATASSTGTLSSNAVTNGYLVIGGNYSSNAYNAIAGGTRLMFGGGDSDAQGNYYIGTNMEDVGGNYNKLDLRWHTGIRMGAQAGYGGIRFFNNEDLSSVLFSIGNTDGNVRSHTNLIPSANNSYNLGGTSNRWANIYTNDLHLSNEGKEGGNEIDGTTGDWTIQEGQENLYIINHKNGKKFKIDLTEIV